MGRDCGRANDKRWLSALQQMLELTASQRYEEEPDALLVHLLTPQALPPDPQLVLLRTLPGDAPLDTFADQLVGGDTPDSVEPPTSEWTTLPSGERAAAVVSHFREQDGSVRTDLRGLWHVHGQVLAVLQAASYDIGRVLRARPDLITLAGSVRFHLVPAGGR